jgi:hypothetical protein
MKLEARNLFLVMARDLCSVPDSLANLQGPSLPPRRQAKRSDHDDNFAAVVDPSPLRATVKTRETEDVAVTLTASHTVRDVEPHRAASIPVAVLARLLTKAASGLVSKPANRFHAHQSIASDPEGQVDGHLRARARRAQHLPLVPQLLKLPEQSPRSDPAAPRRTALRRVQGEATRQPLPVVEREGAAEDGRRPASRAIMPPARVLNTHLPACKAEAAACRFRFSSKRSRLRLRRRLRPARRAAARSEALSGVLLRRRC